MDNNGVLVFLFKNFLHRNGMFTDYASLSYSIMYEIIFSASTILDSYAIVIILIYLICKYEILDLLMNMEEVLYFK